MFPAHPVLTLALATRSPRRSGTRDGARATGRASFPVVVMEPLQRRDGQVVNPRAVRTASLSRQAGLYHRNDRGVRPDAPDGGRRGGEGKEKRASAAAGRLGGGLFAQDALEQLTQL